MMEDSDLKSNLALSNTSGLSTCHEDSSLDESIISDRCHSENIQNLHNKIEILLKHNCSLEDQLLRANEQIGRLLNTKKSDGSFKLECELYGLRPLIGECNHLKQNKERIESENEALRSRLKQYLFDLSGKTCLIGELKDKIVQLQVEKQTCISDYDRVKGDLDRALFNVEKLGKLQKWYEDQLKDCHAETDILSGKVSELNIKIDELNDKNSILNLKIIDAQNGHLRMRLDTSKEGDKSLEKKNDFFLAPNLPDIEHHCSVPIIEDLNAELSMTKSRLMDVERQVEGLKSENSELVAKCLVQQKFLSEQGCVNHELHESKKDLAFNLDKALKDKAEKCIEVLDLKNELNALKVEIKVGIEEKQLIESAVEVIRRQLVSFKQNYEQVKSELSSSNKRIVQLEKEKQDWFMRDNWTVCELANSKDKDVQIENLKRKLEECNGKLMETENALLEKTGDIGKYDAALSQYRVLVRDLENKLSALEVALKDREEASLNLKDNVEILRDELKNKDSQLHEALDSLTKMSEKDVIIKQLQASIDQMKMDYRNYLGRSTDDTKFELLHNGTIWKEKGPKTLKCFESFSDQFESLSAVVDRKLTWHERKIHRLETRWAAKKEEDIGRRVNERKMRDKIKKLDSVSRVLLGKVKEHLRDRKLAVKHLNRLYDENECFRLSLSSKERQIEIIEKLAKDYVIDNRRLKGTVGKLENQVGNGCSDEERNYYQIKCKFMEDKCGRLENKNAEFNAELEELQLINGQLDSKLRELESERTKSGDVDSELKVIKQIESKSSKTQVNENLLDDENHQRSIGSAKDYSSHVQEPERYVPTLERSASVPENVTSMLSVNDRLHHFEHEMRSLKSDKYFLQRLCSDLRLAVTTYMDQNERLRERLRVLAPTKPEFGGLPVNNWSENGGTYDEKYIRQLIEENKKSMDTAVVSELYECFSVLKGEMCSLQMQILKM